MKKLIFSLSVLMLCMHSIFAQTNIKSTNARALNVLKGNYNPALYVFGTSDKIAIKQSILSTSNNNEMTEFLKTLSTFENRNTAADTVSEVKGIGASRRWILQQFNQISALANNRLEVSYLTFDQEVCGRTIECRNIYAILPGTDTSSKEIVIIEGHIDSRCEDVCDTACSAHGMEDNGSGTLLVMETCKMLSKHSFKNTIVFLITVGEEQGLMGARAFATYCQNNNIKIRAVLNNDVIGGIICGKTSSPPSCPGEDLVDSINVRIFSAGKNASISKGLARFVKKQYMDELESLVPVKSNILIMNPEDRTGRGGDHIPFREKGYAAIRFTSSYEHGDANPVETYTDRQHSTRDVLGIDTDNDQIIDSLFVNINYLKRNGWINANAAAMAAQGVEIPTIDLPRDSAGLVVTFNTTIPYKKYVVGVRTKFNDFDKLYEVENTNYFSIPGVKKDTTYFISVAAVDTNGTESLFSIEKNAKPNFAVGINQYQNEKAIELLPVQGLKTEEVTVFTIVCNSGQIAGNYVLEIVDISGKLIQQIPVSLKPGTTEVAYEHGYQNSGMYIATLKNNQEIIQSQKFIFN